MGEWWVDRWVGSFVVSPGDIYDMRAKTVTAAPEMTAKTGTGGRGGF